MGESEAGHGQSISQAYDGIQAEGRWAVQEIAAAERARHARRGVCCRDIPSQGRGLRRLRRAPPKAFKEARGRVRAIDARAAQLGMRRSDYLRQLVENDLECAGIA